MNKTLRFVVDESDSGMRIDVFLQQQTHSINRSEIKRLCEQDKVTVNGSPVKAAHKVRPGALVSLTHPSYEDNVEVELDLEVIYEDDDCVVINKPSGILVHSKGAFNSEPTVASWLRKRVPTLEGERAGIVHRLDRATSGVMICSKNDEAHHWLQRQFALRKVKKTYVAIVDGHLKLTEAIIEMPIERNPKAPATFRVGVQGKLARTRYQVLKESPKYTEIELYPETGRTHQLRVHLLYLDHPIVGDTLYGGTPAKRLMLHAAKLEITLPNRERKEFLVPLPPSFTEFMKDDK